MVNACLPRAFCGAHRPTTLQKAELRWLKSLLFSEGGFRVSGSWFQVSDLRQKDGGQV